MFDLINKIDDSFYNRLSVYSKNFLIIFFSFIGNIITSAVFILILLIIPLTLKYGIMSLTGLIFSTIIVFILKYSVKKKRIKYDNYFTSKFDPYSFPSGHAGRLAVFIVTLNNFYSILIFSLLTIVVSIARISRGYHQLSDCITGIIIGIVSGLFALAFNSFYLDFIMNFILPIQKVFNSFVK